MVNTGETIHIGQDISVPVAAVAELARQYHIRRLTLFGSAARGELTPESDIDLIVEFESGKAPSLGGLVDMQDAFSSLFGGRKVDLATPSILNNPYRRRAIEKDMEVLYAA
jgi:predicted nucleotidyltransferase